MRHAMKRDASHASIAKALRAVGADVLEGFDADLYIRFRGQSFLVEVKNQDRTQSRKTGQLRKGSLKPKQERLKAIFGDQYLICFTVEGILRAIGAVQELPNPESWRVA